MSTTSIVVRHRRRRALVAEQEAQGYGVRKILAGRGPRRGIGYMVSVRQGAVPGHESPLPWIEITRNGVHVAGNGGDGAYIYQTTAAGIQAARDDVLRLYSAYIPRGSK